MSSSTMKIKLAVDRSRNRVLFANAGSDFVNVLLSFLTLPLSAVHFCGTTASLGCLPELCDSVSRLRESKLLKVEACHGTLLTPPHTHEFGGCSCDTFVNNHTNLHVDGKLCKFWPVMARLMHAYRNASSAYRTFVRCKERFVISDDWTIKSASTSIMQSLPHNFGSPDAIIHGFEEVEVCVGWSEVVSMLKASLSSDTIFTDVFLPKGTDDLPAGVTVKQSTDKKTLHRSNKGSGSSPERKIKLFCDIRENKVIYAECKRDFVDLLLRFLAYPLGCVIKNMADADGASHLGNGSFDNLYSSVVELDTAGFITSCYYSVQTLLNPSVCPFRSQCYLPTEAVLEPEDQPFLSLAAMSKKTCRDCHHDLVEDRTYVVGDDLLVHQASAISVAKHWYMRDKANVVEMDVTVGKPEAVALLRAVLTSKTALTDVFIGRLEEEEPPATRSP